MDYPNFTDKGPTPCSQVDPEQFFPDPEVDGYLRTQNSAKRICLGKDEKFDTECAYRSECLLWALTNNEFGVWGGTTNNERRMMKQRTARRAVATTAGVLYTPAESYA